MKDLTDIEIIRGCIKGDSGCQEALFYKYSELLFATCLRYMGNEHDAKDILQDSFIKIFQYIHQHDPERGLLKSWMSRICVNNCLKQLKKRKARLSVDAIVEITSDHNIEADIHFEELFKVIMELPAPYRTVVNLYLVEGYSHKEIGELLNVKESSSRSILTRAKKLLTKNITIEKKKESWLI